MSTCGHSYLVATVMDHSTEIPRLEGEDWRGRGPHHFGILPYHFEVTTALEEFIVLTHTRIVLEQRDDVSRAGVDRAMRTHQCVPRAQRELAMDGHAAAGANVHPSPVLAVVSPTKEGGSG